MACAKCDFKGYVVDAFLGDNNEKSTVRMCPHCKDMAAYSQYIKELFGKKVKKEDSHSSELALCHRYYESNSNVVPVDFGKKTITIISTDDDKDLA